VVRPGGSITIAPKLIGVRGQLKQPMPKVLDKDAGGERGCATVAHIADLESEPFRSYDSVSGLAGAKASRMSPQSTDCDITGPDDRRSNAAE
jgi:hypothetical protein